MPELPTGTVTFLFTDIEGSSLLWQRHRREMPDALVRHEGLLRDAIAAHGGHVFKTVGDQFCAVFSRAPDAVAAALDAQRALHDEAWEVPGGIRVRMILHSGIAQERDRDYFGTTLNRTARMLAAGHGSQILLSQAAWELAWDELPPGVQGRDVGEHQLKDVPRPERLFQLIAPGLPADFPPLRAPEAPEGVRPGTPPRPRKRAAFLAALLVLALLLLIAVVVWFIPRDGPGGTTTADQPPDSAAPALAVLPFTIREPALEVWREGMVDVLSNNLEGVLGLRMIDSRTVLARWRERVQGATTPDLETMLEVARATEARYTLVGSAVASGAQLRFVADVYEVTKGTNLGTAQEEGLADSLLVLVDRFSIQVLRALPLGSSQDPDPRRPTDCLPCFIAWLKGEAALRRSDFDQAGEAYRQAVEGDSTFALALDRLATASGWTEHDEVVVDVDRAYMERAARLASRLTERRVLLVRAKLARWRGTLDGLASLRQAVRKYPDDAEAQYLLGETLFHLGRQALASQDEIDQALVQAIKLDPGFAPAYIHLIENAFNYHADSARAAQLVEAYGRLTAGSESARRSWIASALAFGDSATRSRASAALDTLPARDLLSIALHLWHPRFGAAQEEVLAAARGKGQAEDPDAAVLLYVNGLLRGKLQAALGALEDPGMPEGYRSAGLYIPFMARLPVVPSEQLERQLALGERDSLPYLRTFYAGAYAADRERWAENATAVSRLRTAASRALAEGDSTTAGFTKGMATALEGYGMLKKGRSDEALLLLREGQRQATALAPLEVVNATIRFWLSRLLFDRGEFEEAQRYAASFWQDPLAAFWLAQVYEQMEDYGKARAEFEFFAESWRDADSDLQPLVEEARRSAARLEVTVR